MQLCLVASGWYCAPLTVVSNSILKSVDECINVYLSSCEEVFRVDHVLAGNIPTGNCGCRFDFSVLERVTKRTVAQRLGDENALVKDDPSSDAPLCRTFVVANSARNAGQRKLFRSYGWDAAECPIWQAARATTSTSSLFKPSFVESPKPGTYYIDGSFQYNNPSKLVLEEAWRLWPHAGRFCLVSVGTGKRSKINFMNAVEPQRGQSRFGSLFKKLNVVAITRQLKKFISIAEPSILMSTTSERVHHELWDIATEQSTKFDLEYHRFDPERGLETVSLHDWKEIPRIVDYIQSYMMSPLIQRQIKASMRLHGVRPTTPGPDTDSIDSRDTIGDFAGVETEPNLLVANGIDMDGLVVNMEGSIRETSSTIRHPLLRRKADVYSGSGGHSIDGITEGEPKEGASTRRYNDPDLDSKKVRDDLVHGSKIDPQWRLTIENEAEIWRQVDDEPENEAFLADLDNYYSHGMDHPHRAHGWLKLVERHPKVKSLHSRLSQTYSDSGDYNAAIVAWLCLWEKFPTNINFLRYLQDVCNKKIERESRGMPLSLFFITWLAFFSYLARWLLQWDLHTDWWPFVSDDDLMILRPYMVKYFYHCVHLMCKRILTIRNSLVSAVMNGSILIPNNFRFPKLGPLRILFPPNPQFQTQRLPVHQPIRSLIQPTRHQRGVRATRQWPIRVEKFLVQEAEANVESKDENGKTAFDLARQGIERSWTEEPCKVVVAWMEKPGPEGGDQRKRRTVE